MKSLRLCVLLVGLTLVAMPGCQQITDVPPRGASVSMTIPESVTIQRGQTQNVKITVRRYNLDQPVRVSLSGLPEGVSAEESSLSVTGDSATFILTASATADLVTNHPVTVTLDSPGGERAGENNMLLTVATVTRVPLQSSP